MTGKGLVRNWISGELRCLCDFAVISKKDRRGTPVDTHWVGCPAQPFWRHCQVDRRTPCDSVGPILAAVCSVLAACLAAPDLYSFWG